MRIEDGIIELLSYMEFQRLNVKIENIEMFYRSNSMGTDIAHNIDIIVIA